jgi:hypothetical protein
MASVRKRRQKQDLSGLSAWPHPLKSRTGGPHGKCLPKTETPPRTVTLPQSVRVHEHPALYHETYLRVIPRDPFSLYSFWEIAEGSSVPGGAPLLRLYETDSEKIMGDYAVIKGARSQYIRVPEPGRRYRLEYGIATPDRFIPLCSSNEITAPAGRVQEPLTLTKDNKDRHTAAEVLLGFSARALTAAASPQGAAADMVALAAGL